MNELEDRFGALDHIDSPDLWPRVLSPSLHIVGAGARVEKPKRGPARRFAVPAVAAAVVAAAVVTPLVLLQPNTDDRVGLAGTAGTTPLTARVEYIEGNAVYDARFDYLDRTHWRLEYLGGNAAAAHDSEIPARGRYAVADGDHFTVYDPVQRTQTTDPLTPGMMPGDLVWLPGTADDRGCGDPVADGTMLGRSVLRFECTADGVHTTYRVDQATGLIVERTNAGTVGRLVRSLRLRTSFPPNTFTAGPAPKPRHTAALRTGERLPEWRLSEVGSSHRVSLTDLRGAPAVVLFWAPWCDPCTGGSGLDLLAAVAQRHPNAGAVAIATQSNLPDVETFLTDHPQPGPVLFDGTGAVLRSWRVNALPAFVVIDAKARLVGVTAGNATPDDLTALLQRARR